MSRSKNSQAFGLLAMASEDARRFYPEMGTLYLKRLGELGSAAFGALSDIEASGPVRRAREQSFCAPILGHLANERRLSNHTVLNYERDISALLAARRGGPAREAANPSYSPLRLAIARARARWQEPGAHAVGVAWFYVYSRRDQRLYP